MDMLSLKSPNISDLFFPTIFLWCVGSSYHIGTDISQGSFLVSYFLVPLESYGCTNMGMLDFIDLKLCFKSDFIVEPSLEAIDWTIIYFLKNECFV